jgi:hypothetical protein
MEFREKPHTDKHKRITNDSNYVASCTPTSPQVRDLEYFDRLIFVAQSVQSTSWMSKQFFLFKSNVSANRHVKLKPLLILTIQCGTNSDVCIVTSEETE